jgi:AraC family transcriptional regulator, transcriptional activator of pobA
MMQQNRHIPAYSLFGEAAGLVEPGFCHVERIGDRWRLHGGQVEGHSHPHLHQMTLWIAGYGHYIADETTSAISPTTMCWMPAGVVHGFRVKAGSEAIVLSMSDDFAREQLSVLTGTTGILPFSEKTILHLHEEDTNWLLSLFLRMEREYAGVQAAQVECIGALARLALAETLRLARGTDVLPVSPGIEPSLLVRFMGLVEARLGERPGIDELASELGSTPYLLNRACRTGLGMRASDVVRARHLQEAKRLLLFTSLNVNEVAQVAGYPDPAHFTRSFRAQTGQTPQKWRERRISGEMSSPANRSE